MLKHNLRTCGPTKKKATHLRRLLQIVEMDLVQPAVEGAAGQQLLVAANVEDPARLHHHDPVGQRQDGQAVGNQDRGAVRG